MQKSIYTREYNAVTKLLRQFRENAEITQNELGDKLSQSQSFVSKVERGERRLDIVQLRTICEAVGTTLPLFVEALEKSLSRRKRR